MEIDRVACEGNPEEGDKRERGKCERKEKLILDMRFFVASPPLSIPRCGRCAAVSHFLIISHSDTANTAFGGFCFRHLAPLSIPRCGRCAAVSRFLIFLTATQRTQRTEAFAFAISRPLSILRRGRCAAVSHFLIFLTATQRTQRLETSAFAASRTLPPPFDSALWTLCRCEPISYFSHSDTTNTAVGGFCFRRLPPLFIPRCGRCAAVSHLLIFLTATQRTQRL